MPLHASTYFEAIDREEATDNTFLQTGTENDDIILFIHDCWRKKWESWDEENKWNVIWLLIKLLLWHELKNRKHVGTSL